MYTQCHWMINLSALKPNPLILIWKCQTLCAQNSKTCMIKSQNPIKEEQMEEVKYIDYGFVWWQKGCPIHRQVGYERLKSGVLRARSYVLSWLIGHVPCGLVTHQTSHWKDSWMLWRTKKFPIHLIGLLRAFSFTNIQKNPCARYRDLMLMLKSTVFNLMSLSWVFLN